MSQFRLLQTGVTTLNSQMAAGWLGLRLCEAPAGIEAIRFVEAKSGL